MLTVLLTAMACGDDDDANASPNDTGQTSADPVTLRLGYFPNVTHAPAILGVENGFFEDTLGDNVTLETSTFNAGTEAIEALFSDAIDATFIGPNPAINGFAQESDSLRIVAGTTSGGASLVVKPEITEAEDLRGKTLASPSLGNTQDVALRAWLAENGLEADEAGGGDVSIQPQSNADTLTAFQEGTIDGAWVPEPWATRLLLEGDGEVLVDEADLWPNGKFVTTHLIVATHFLEEHPDAVKGLIQGLIDAIDFANENPEEAEEATNTGIEAITGAALPAETIAGAWENLTFTWDPIASSLEGSKDAAVEIGLLDPVQLDGIYELDLLNEVLESRSEDPVEEAAS